VQIIFHHLEQHMEELICMLILIPMPHIASMTPALDEFLFSISEHHSHCNNLHFQQLGYLPTMTGSALLIMQEGKTKHTAGKGLLTPEAPKTANDSMKIII
jgi:hypothetical protein